MGDSFNTIEDYVPKAALPLLSKYLSQWEVNLVITRKRITKHGDFRAFPKGGHQITVNESTNPFRFLITALHEISHLVAFKNFGLGIKPHGVEWKITYKKIMSPFLTSEIFPAELLKVLQLHFKNPKASSDADFSLVMALNKFDPENEKSFIFELDQGTVFEIYNGRRFVRGEKRVKRFECKELNTQRMYLFSPHAKVIKIK
jgi:SprT protein